MNMQFKKARFSTQIIFVFESSVSVNWTLTLLETTGIYFINLFCF